MPERESPIDDSPIRDALARIPEGATEGWFEGARYGLRKETLIGGRVIKFFAEERGGIDFISANVYLTGRGTVLKPCEMPAARVLGFLAGVRTEPPAGPRPAPSRN